MASKPRAATFFSLLLLGVLDALAPATANESASRPNVVIILADDLGFGDPGSYNPKSKIPTPNIDKLASQGMRFTDAHTPSSVCSPTRYALLTGRYAWRTPLKSGVLKPYDPPLIEDERLSIAKLLKRTGYATACIGKWHLGWRWRLKDGSVHRGPFGHIQFRDKDVDLTQPVGAGPAAAGFDYYFGIDVANYPPYGFIENQHMVGGAPDQPKPQNMFGNPGRMQAGWKLERILPTLERKAVAFIEERAATNPDQPFFLYFSLNAPHTPIAPSRPYRGLSSAGDYGDFVAEVDHAVGSVMSALERTKAADETLLIFTSDNGSPARAGDPHLRGEHWAAAGAVTRIFGHDPNSPWRGMKSDAWEGGHRVPLIVRWPGKVEADTVNGSLVSLVDLMSTIATIVGEKLPADAAEDSFDLLSTLSGANAGKPVREDLIHHSGAGLFALRSGKWRLILGLGSGGMSDPQSIQPQEGQPRGQLFDLENDPREAVNLYERHPDIVESLTSRLERQRTRSGTRPGRESP